jgi:hypothetical protein
MFGWSHGQLPARDDDAVFKTEAGEGVTVRRASAAAAVILHLALGAAGSL